MRIYLSGKRIMLTLLCSLFTYTFLSISELPWSVYMLSLAFSVLLLGIYLLFNADIILLRRYRAVNILALVYCASIMISVYLNGQMSVYVLMVVILRIMIFPFIEIQREKGHLLFLCKIVLFWLCFFLFFSDVLMVIMPDRFYGDGISKTFLLGNKFEVGYDHIILLLMFCILYGKKPVIRRYLLLLFAAVCAVCYYIDCNTAIVGTFVFFLISYAPNSVIRLFGQKKTVLAVVVCCALFIFFGNIVQIPVVKYLITDVLGRDVTLTGRAQIYKVVPMVIRAHPWIGYGDSAGIIHKYTGAYNAQNGFFDLVVRNGIPSAMFYIVMLTALIKKPQTMRAVYLVGAIYAYLIMSTVEVTFGTALMLFGIMLFTDIGDYREEPVTIIEWKGEKR